MEGNKVLERHEVIPEKKKTLNLDMKRFLLILLSIAAILCCSTAYAQRVTNSNYQTVAHIKSDGTIQDASYRTVGHIKSDGTVQDTSYRTVGHLKSDGTVQNSNYSTIGHIKNDGTVQDGNYRAIGHIKDDGTIWALISVSMLHFL